MHTYLIQKIAAFQFQIDIHVCIRTLVFAISSTKFSVCEIVVAGNQRKIGISVKLCSDRHSLVLCVFNVKSGFL